MKWISVAALTLLACVLLSLPATGPAATSRAEADGEQARDLERSAQSARAQQRRRGRGLLFGINDDWQDHAGKVRLAKRVGAKAIRFPLSWGRIQPNPNPDPSTWNWGVYDEIFAQAVQHRVKLILVPQSAPAWARPSTPPGASGSWRPDPGFVDELKHFVQAAVLRYGNRTIAVEAWNEPNLEPFYAPEPNPGEYVNVLRAIHDGTKEVSNKKVILGGLAFSKRNRRGHSFRPHTFVRKVNRKGGKRLYDAVGFHFFSNMSKARTQIKKLRRAAARGGRSVWITETGRSVKEEGSKRKQARALKQLYNQTRRIRGVDALMVHSMFDNRQASNRRIGTMGLIDARGRKKPSFRMFAKKLGRRR